MKINGILKPSVNDGEDDGGLHMIKPNETLFNMRRLWS